MLKFRFLIIFILCYYMPEGLHARKCSRYPSNTVTPKSPVDENFAISITGNPQTYILGQTYNVSLLAHNGHRFLNAKLVLENENGEKSYNEDLGHLEVIDPVETRYSPNCINMLESTNTNPKSRIDMVWVAPSEPGNGCVLIRATVLQHRDVWFMDDGALTKRVCEEIVDDVESNQPDDSENQCCACDEARYELTFEGLWSRNLHPKDFPTRGWTTRFSDILGAAHTNDYRFWSMGSLASREMKELAEHGSSRGLEIELNGNFKAGKVRTIIKARGPAFPNLNSQSVASVRVDPLHHQLSLASKIEPSPDWIVGISGLELCLSNCTWLEEKVISLYPWDIGTDAGPTYTSHDQPQRPPDVIRRMRSDFPSDPRSPFYDETGAPMKPLAKLIIKRQKIYERKCEDEDSNPEENIPRECSTHPWSAWTECSAECGDGIQQRSRVFKQADIAEIFNCDSLMVNHQERNCRGEKCQGLKSLYGAKQWQSEEDQEHEEDGGYDDDVNAEDEFNILQPILSVRGGRQRGAAAAAACEVGEWSEWSECSKNCGEGRMLRRRQYANPQAETNCQRIQFLKLFEYKKCMGYQCSGGINRNRNANDDRLSESENVEEEEDEEEEEENELEEAEEETENQQETEQFSKYNNHRYNSRIQTNRVRERPYQLNTRFLQNSQANNQSPEQTSLVFDTDLREEPPIEFESENLKSEQQTDERLWDARGYTIARPQAQYSSYNARPYDKMHGYAKYGDFQFSNQVPEFCYQSLRISECRDQRVIGNFWFYNYCTDECMLYAADICDRNLNKFSSMEKCEEQCATPMRSVEAFLHRKQQEGCRRSSMAAAAAASFVFENDNGIVRKRKYGRG